MALHKDFPQSPHAILDPGIRWFPADEALRESSIQIMRVFTRLRQILLSNKDIKRDLEELKRLTDDRFQIVFETLDQLLSVEERPKRKIGFTAKEKRAAYTVRQKRK